MATTERPAFSVSDAMALAKGALETIRITVVGEVSEATIKPGYKAIYFSLKDASCVMPCLMWRDVYEASGVKLEDGRLVEITGYFTLYAAKGRLQFQVRQVVMAGEGVLRMQVAALARQLEAEGLMAAERKRELPAFPRRIAVVTSPRGKAVHDIIRTLRRRYPVAELVIAGVQVEGDGAVSEIVRGLKAAGAEPGVDVVILGRGGGSYEDLMPFNAEEVARAVAACPVPVVTGIGHEPDTSIADMVSDLRASTPTAAAEAVAPSIVEVRDRLQAQRRLLGRALSHVVASSAHRLNLIAARPVFCDATVLVAARLQSLDVLADALGRALPARIERQEHLVAQAASALGRLGPHVLDMHGMRLERLRERALDAGADVLGAAERGIAAAAARLEDLSPLGILARGYAVCYEDGGAIVRAAGDVQLGSRVRVRLAKGQLGCVVDSIEAEG